MVSPSAQVTYSLTVVLLTARWCSCMCRQETDSSPALLSNPGKARLHCRPTRLALIANNAQPMVPLRLKACLGREKKRGEWGRGGGRGMSRGRESGRPTTSTVATRADAAHIHLINCHCSTLRSKSRLVGWMSPPCG